MAQSAGDHSKWREIRMPGEIIQHLKTELYYSLLSLVCRNLYIVADMSHPLFGQSCDRGEEIIGRSSLQERYADMQSGRGVIRATV
ncbi:hypothetical protein OUZ56_012977 [Daphnia magna]|uniref:Uncharacterized protein n=1 Tax=Daphnia magna TaxID=35525 RepID=A0ABQ9Z5R4_9CRUS|nr:hypothetical protein OUZ56_012977 [Daphnia magna]